MINIAGRVRSGRGRASAQVAAVKVEVEAITNQVLAPGTLNIILDRPLRLNKAEALFFDQNARMLWPATLNDLDVWVYRWKHTALHVVEVLSSVHLRGRFGLKDGDRIILAMRPEHIDRIGAMERAAWALVWAGRRDLCYTNDRYYFAVYRFCEALGATQQRPARKLINIPWGWVRLAIERTPVVGTTSLEATEQQQPCEDDLAKIPNAFGTKPTDLKTS